MTDNDGGSNHENSLIPKTYLRSLAIFTSVVSGALCRPETYYLFHREEVSGLNQASASLAGTELRTIYSKRTLQRPAAIVRPPILAASIDLVAPKSKDDNAWTVG
jgi:hypothetical protein